MVTSQIISWKNFQVQKSNVLVTTDTNKYIGLDLNIKVTLQLLYTGWADSNFFQSY